MIETLLRELRIQPSGDDFVGERVVGTSETALTERRIW
jgi:hypothetical protein